MNEISWTVSILISRYETFSSNLMISVLGSQRCSKEAEPDPDRLDLEVDISDLARVWKS